ncbi:hypothetical protein Apmu_0011_27 [Acidiphilium multivorum AIU301]|nr:hypothetical protein Apmu_0011_27 [Acidiphilium multivorum AIU301]
MRQAHMAGMPIDEPHPKILLKGHDLPAERRLGKVQPLRCAPEMERLGECDEVTQLADIGHDTE